MSDSYHYHVVNLVVVNNGMSMFMLVGDKDELTLTVLRSHLESHRLRRAHKMDMQQQHHAGLMRRRSLVAGADLVVWDACRLPLRPGIADRVIADFPPRSSTKATVRSPHSHPPNVDDVLTPTPTPKPKPSPSPTTKGLGMAPASTAETSLPPSQAPAPSPTLSTSVSEKWGKGSSGDGYSLVLAHAARVLTVGDAKINTTSIASTTRTTSTTTNGGGWTRDRGIVVALSADHRALTHTVGRIARWQVVGRERVSLAGVPGKMVITRKCPRCFKDLTVWVGQSVPSLPDQTPPVDDRSEDILGLAKFACQGFCLDATLALCDVRASVQRKRPQHNIGNMAASDTQRYSYHGTEDLLFSVELLSTFFHPHHHRHAHCYRVWFGGGVSNDQSKLLERLIREEIQLRTRGNGPCDFELK